MQCLKKKYFLSQPLQNKHHHWPCKHHYQHAPACSTSIPLVTLLQVPFSSPRNPRLFVLAVPSLQHTKRLRQKAFSSPPPRRGESKRWPWTHHPPPCECLLYALTGICTWTRRLICTSTSRRLLAYLTIEWKRDLVDLRCWTGLSVELERIRWE